jgi:hypothetical protein
MNASNQISAVFSVFVKCPTKAHLLAIGEPAPGASFVDIEAGISSMYKPVQSGSYTPGQDWPKFSSSGYLWCTLDDEKIPNYVDCETAVDDFAPPEHGYGVANHRNHRHRKLCPPSWF